MNPRTSEPYSFKQSTKLCIIWPTNKVGSSIPYRLISAPSPLPCLGCYSGARIAQSVVNWAHCPAWCNVGGSTLLWVSGLFVCLSVTCLTSQQHASVSQGRICTDNFTCCHTEIEAADQTFHLTQSQYTDTGQTSPSADPITPGAWQPLECQCLSHWYDSTPKKSRRKRDSNPGPSALPLGQRGGWASGRGDFSLGVNTGSDSIPKKTFGWEYKLRSSLCTHAFHRTDSHNPEMSVLDGWMPAAKTNPS